MKWTEKYKFLASDTDLNDVISPSSILRYMQDTANCNMDAGRPTYSELLERGLAFILSRISINFYSPIHAHDEVVSESWPTPSRGVTFNRCYRMTRDGDIVAEASSAWALVSTDDKRLLRVSEFECGYGEDEPLEMGLSRFKIPSDLEMTLRGERRVEYADADVNGHMNNAHYPDILLSYTVPMKGLRVTNMNISFINEAPVGCLLKFYAGECDGVYYIRTLREDGSVNAEASVTFEKI